MARRKKKDGSLGGGIAIAILAFIKPILAILVNVLTLLGLPAMLALYSVSRRKRDLVLADPASKIPNPENFDWSEEKLGVHTCSLLLQKSKLDVNQIYMQGKDANLRRTDASEGLRFDQRNKYGASLNEMLDGLEAHIEHLAKKRRDVRYGALARVPEWREAHNAVVDAESSWRAAKLGLLTYIGVFPVLLAVRPGWVQSLSSMAIEASGSLRVVFGPAALATVAACLAFLIFRSKYRRSLDETINVVEVREWSKIESEIRTSDYFPGIELLEDSSLENRQSNESAAVSEARRVSREVGAKILGNLLKNITKSG